MRPDDDSPANHEETDALSFTDDENWIGGFYGLAIEYARKTADANLVDAFWVVWNRTDLEGPYSIREAEPEDQPEWRPIGAPYRAFGRASLPTGVAAVCDTIVLDDGVSRWFNLGIPIGSLGRADKRWDGYPEDSGPDRTWRPYVDDWFVGIARSVYEAAPFMMASVGHEMSGWEYAHSRETSDGVGDWTTIRPESGILRVYRPRYW